MENSTPTPTATHTTQATAPMDPITAAIKAMETAETKAPEAAPVPAAETTEAKAEAPKVETAVDDDPRKDPRFASKFAALDKKAREVQLETKAAKEERAKYAKYIDAEKLAKDDPLKFIEQYGITFEGLAERVIENPKKPPTEIELLRKEVEETKRQLSEKDKAVQVEKEAKLVQDFKNEQKEFILKQGEKYEILNAFGNYDQVFETAQAYFKEHNEVPTHEDMAAKVEEYFEKEITAALEIAKKVKKFSRYFNAAETKTVESKPQEDKSHPGSLVKQAQTLTNKMSQETVANPDADRYLTEEERFKKALSLIR